MKFRCPICGKEIEKLGVCDNCKKIKLTKRRNYIEVCKKCGRIHYKQGFQYVDLKFPLKNIYKEKVEIVDYEILENKIKLKVKYENKVIEDEINIKYSVCKDCIRKDSHYYESIIQLRTSNNRELLEFIKDFVENINMPRNFISKIEDRKEGIDIYLGSKKIAKKITRILKKENYKIKSSFSLWGKNKEGKELYRDIYCIRD